MLTNGIIIKLGDHEEVSLYSNGASSVSLNVVTVSRETLGVTLNKKELRTLREIIDLVLKEDTE